MRERGVHGSPVNQYAPFYLWNTIEGMNSFLWGAGFQGIVDDFGRPVGAALDGARVRGGRRAPATVPRVAVRRRQPVAGGRRELAEVDGGRGARGSQRLAGEDGAVLAAAAVDSAPLGAGALLALGPRRRPKAEGEVFEVLHLSAPERERLPRGRHW